MVKRFLKEHKIKVNNVSAQHGRFSKMAHTNMFKTWTMRTGKCPWRSMTNSDTCLFWDKLDSKNAIWFSFYKHLIEISSSQNPQQRLGRGIPSYCWAPLLLWHHGDHEVVLPENFLGASWNLACHISVAISHVGSIVAKGPLELVHVGESRMAYHLLECVNIVDDKGCTHSYLHLSRNILAQNKQKNIKIIQCSMTKTILRVGTQSYLDKQP